MVVPIFVKRSTALEEMDWQQILEVSCSQNKLHALHSGYTYTDLWLSLTADSSHMHVPMYSVNNPKGQQSPSASMAVPWRVELCWFPGVLTSPRCRIKCTRYSFVSPHRCGWAGQWLGMLAKSTDMFPESHAVLAPTLRRTGRLKRDHLPRKACASTRLQDVSSNFQWCGKEYRQ